MDILAISDREALGMAAVVYGTAALLGAAALLSGQRHPRALLWSFLVGGFLLQTLGLNLRGAQIHACPLGNPFEIGHFIAWSFVLLFFIIGPAFRLQLLGWFTTMLAALVSGAVFLVPGWDRPYPPGLFGGNPWIELHAALAIFSYGVFAILALVSLMFLIQQHGLKKKRFKGIYQFLPSVQQLDLMAKRLLVAGTIVLTAALLFGSVFWLQNPERVPALKLSVTCLVWVGYGAVGLLRLRKKLVTRRHAIASIVLFCLAMLSLWPVQSATRIHADERAAPTPLETPPAP